MKKVVMYKTPQCVYCKHAAALLKSKGLAFEEIDISTSTALMDEMIEKSKRRTVPQIFIGDRHVGGFTDLAALDATGELDQLLHEEK